MNMNATKLRTIAQLQDFLTATPAVSFSGIGEKDDSERYALMCRWLSTMQPRQHPLAAST